MKKMLKRYIFFVLLLLINILVLIIYPEVGRKSFSITWNNTIEMGGNSANIYSSDY